MATPIASGVVATMLQAEPSLTPQEVKDILRNSSEQRGSASEPSVSDRWNSDWGFGLIDASCAIDMALNRACTPLEGAGVVAPPPTGNGSGDHVTINNPSNGSWWVEGDRERISGVALESEVGPYDEVQIRIEQHLESGTVRELQGWITAGGDVSNWYLDVSVSSDWVRADEDYTLILARAISDDGEESLLDARYVRLARMLVTLAGPSVGTLLDGSVEFSGTVEGLEHDRLEYKVDSGEWLLGEELDFLDVGTQDWSFSWNSNSVEDGSHRLSFRMVNDSGVATDTIRRTYTIDNQPAAPDFVFQSTVEILDQGLPVYSAVAGTVLEVDFTIANVGDLDATDVYVRLEAAGSASETYPSETSIGILNEGESRQITLYWWATEPGQQEVTITIDPTSQHADPTPDNNVYSFTFEVEERPVESMLRYLPGSVTTVPNIPTPNTPFTLRLRVDNLGQTDATSLTMKLFYDSEDGWSPLGTEDILVVPGSDTSSGYAIATFSVNSITDPGAMKFKAELDGNGVEAEFSQHRFTIAVDDVSLGAQVGVDLATGEVPVEFIGLEDGALLFTTVNGELHVRSITESMSVQTDLLLEDMWGGELAVLEREDGLIQAAWTRKSISADGYTLTNIGMTALSKVEIVTPVHYQMPAQKLSEGSYWGLDLTEYDGMMVLAGYHRDIKTEGSWQDVTSIFTLVSNNPDGATSWGNPINVLSNIDIRPSKGDALAIAYGEENLHILYQEMRDDVTGINRVGLMYTHGDATLSSWSFQSSVGDEASNARLDAKQDEDGDDVLIAAWIEGRGKDAKIAHVVTGNSWSVNEPTYISAPGVTYVELHSAKQGMQIFYDEINTFGPTTRYGLLTDADHQSTDAMSNLMAEGFLQGYAGLEYDGIVMLTTASGSIKLRTLASLAAKDLPQDDGGSILDSLLAPLPGDRDAQLMMLGGVSFLLVMLLTTIVVSIRRGRLEEQKAYVATEVVTATDDSVELMIQPEGDDGPLLAIDTESEELVVDTTAATVVLEDEDISLADSLEAKAEAGAGNARLNRRMQRKQQREFAEITQNLPPLPPPPGPNATAASPSALPPLPAPGELPPLPAPGELPMLGGLPPLPGIAPPQRDLTCPECSAKFVVKDMTLRKVACPICSTNVQC